MKDASIMAQNNSKYQKYIASRCHNDGLRLYNLKKYRFASIYLKCSCALWQKWLFTEGTENVEGRAHDYFSEKRGAEIDRSEDREIVTCPLVVPAPNETATCHSRQSALAVIDPIRQPNHFLSNALLGESKLSSRFELLAACRSRAGDADGAVDAIQRAIRFWPSTTVSTRLASLCSLYKEKSLSKWSDTLNFIERMCAERGFSRIKCYDFTIGLACCLIHADLQHLSRLLNQRDEGLARSFGECLRETIMCLARYNEDAKRGKEKDAWQRGDQLVRCIGSIYHVRLSRTIGAVAERGDGAWAPILPLYRVIEELEALIGGFEGQPYLHLLALHYLAVAHMYEASTDLQNISNQEADSADISSSSQHTQAAIASWTSFVSIACKHSLISYDASREEGTPFITHDLVCIAASISACAEIAGLQGLSSLRLRATLLAATVKSRIITTKDGRVFEIDSEQLKSAGHSKMSFEEGILSQKNTSVPITTDMATAAGLFQHFGGLDGARYLLAAADKNCTENEVLVESHRALLALELLSLQPSGAVDDPKGMWERLQQLFEKENLGYREEAIIRHAAATILSAARERATPIEEALKCLKMRYSMLDTTERSLFDKKRHNKEECASRQMIAKKISGDQISEQQGKDPVFDLSQDPVKDLQKSVDVENFLHLREFVESILQVGVLWQKRSMCRQSKQILQQGLALAKVLHAPALTVAFLFQLGNLAVRSNDLVVARELLQRSLSLSHSVVNILTGVEMECGLTGDGKWSIETLLHPTMSGLDILFESAKCLIQLGEICFRRISGRNEELEETENIFLEASKFYESADKLLEKANFVILDSDRECFPRIYDREYSHSDGHFVTTQNRLLNRLAFGVNLGKAKLFLVHGDLNKASKELEVCRLVSLQDLSEKCSFAIVEAQLQLARSNFDAATASANRALEISQENDDSFLEYRASHLLSYLDALRDKPIASAFYATSSVGFTITEEVYRLSHRRVLKASKREARAAKIGSLGTLGVFQEKCSSALKEMVVCVLQISFDRKCVLCHVFSEGKWHLMIKKCCVNMYLERYSKIMKENQLTLANSQKEMSNKEKREWWQQRALLDKALQDFLIEFEGACLPRFVDLLDISTTGGKMVFAKMTVKDLKMELRRLGLPVSGRKDVLIERLTKACAANKPIDPPLVLILDDELSMLPIESIPTLENKVASRMPSFYALLSSPKKKCSKSEAGDRISFLVDPENDLPRTQKVFTPALFKACFPDADVQGISGRGPSCEEMNSLIQCETLIYCGHGSCEQYIRREDVATLESSPSSVFLFGCSSARVKNFGDFGNHGAVYSWVFAGCESVIGFLYDVTTGDADKMAMALLKDPRCDIGKARAKAKFRYLNGAALVRYGLPLLTNVNEKI